MISSVGHYETYIGNVGKTHGAACILCELGKGDNVKHTIFHRETVEWQGRPWQAKCHNTQGVQLLKKTKDCTVCYENFATGLSEKYYEKKLNAWAKTEIWKKLS